MQADNTSQSVAVVQLLKGKDECASDLSLDGLRLRPVLFGSRFNQSFERHYHSFVGEIACGRWAISCCRRSEGNLGVYWEYPPTPPLVTGSLGL